ncbi:MAG: MerC domain-containing protein [Bacteroidota bacterium]
MLSKFSGLNLDFAGAAAATLCTLHCAAFPILLSFGFISSTSHNHIIDWTLMLVGVLIAGIVLIRDYKSVHKNRLPTILASIGFSVLFFGIESHGEFLFLNILGGCFMVASHFFNWRLSHTH